MPKQIPAHTYDGEYVLFEDGVRFKRTAPRPGETRASIEEMYRLVTGCDLPKTTAADLAEVPKKVMMDLIDHRKG